MVYIGLMWYYMVGIRDSVGNLGKRSGLYVVMLALIFREKLLDFRYVTGLVHKLNIQLI